MKMQKRLITWMLASCLTIGVGPALAAPEDPPGPGAMTADLLIARPFGMAVAVLGAATFVVSLPFSALGGNVDDAAENLVVEPARAAFIRCLGCRTSGRNQNKTDE